jgi:hypothetical protein
MVGGRPESPSARQVFGTSTHWVCDALLWSGAGWRVRMDRGRFGPVRSIFVPAITFGCSRRALWNVTTDAVLAAVGETSVEVVLPEGRGCLQLCCPGWSWVVGVDAIGCPPHRDFAHDGKVRAAARRRPHRLGIILAGVTSDPIGEAGN